MTLRFNNEIKIKDLTSLSRSKDMQQYNRFTAKNIVKNVWGHLLISSSCRTDGNDPAFEIKIKCYQEVILPI